jgi:hypothetical protein
VGVWGATGTLGGGPLDDRLVLREEPSANDDVARTPARRNQGFRGCLRDRGRMGGSRYGHYGLGPCGHFAPHVRMLCD